jgi:hypothetical protein
MGMLFRKGKSMKIKSSIAKTANPNTLAVRLRTVFAARLLLLLLLALPVAVQARQFHYPPFSCTINKGTITITKYTGSGGAVTIPDTINGLPVTSIGYGAFYRCTSLTSVTIPDNVTSIGNNAFYHCTSLINVTIGNSVTSIGNNAFDKCTSLTGVFFQGNAPSIGSSVFSGDNSTTVYYLPGTTGWSSSFAGCPTALWNPRAQTGDGRFGIRTNRFGFNITGTANIPIVVEACTNLVHPVWVPLLSCTLTNGSLYFSDPAWTNYPRRFYHLRSP